MERCQCQARSGSKERERKKKKISPSNLVVSSSSHALSASRAARRRSDLKHHVASPPPPPPPSPRAQPQPQWVKVEAIKVNLILTEWSPYESGRLSLLKTVVFGAAAGGRSSDKKTPGRHSYVFHRTLLLLPRPPPSRPAKKHYPGPHAFRSVWPRPMPFITRDIFPFTNQTCILGFVSAFRELAISEQ